MTRAWPDWPRMLRRPLAASYAGYSAPQFDRAVAADEMPEPVHTSAGERWDRRAIDGALDRLANGGEAVADWRVGARERMAAR